MIEDLPFFNQPYPTTSFSSGRRPTGDIHAIVRNVWNQEPLVNKTGYSNVYHGQLF